LVHALEQAREGQTCILGEVDVAFPYLAVLLPAAGLGDVRLVGNGSAARPADLSAIDGCNELQVPPIQRVMPGILRDYVCPAASARTSEGQVLPGGARCRLSTAGHAPLMGLHAHLRALAGLAAAAASSPEPKTVVLVSRSPKLWTALHNSCAANPAPHYS